MSEDIKFSTAGFRAVTADGLTAQSVQRLTYGISEHILEHPFYGFEGTGYRKHCEEQGKLHHCARLAELISAAEGPPKGQNRTPRRHHVSGGFLFLRWRGGGGQAEKCL